MTTPSCSGKRKAPDNPETSPSDTQKKDKQAKSELPTHLFGPPQQSTPKRDLALEPSFGSFVGAGLISKILVEEEVLESEGSSESRESTGHEMETNQDEQNAFTASFVSALGDPNVRTILRGIVKGVVVG